MDSKRSDSWWGSSHSMSFKSNPIEAIKKVEGLENQQEKLDLVLRDNVEVIEKVEISVKVDPRGPCSSHASSLPIMEVQPDSDMHKEEVSKFNLCTT
jgi:hypothetical protein